MSQPGHVSMTIGSVKAPQQGGRTGIWEAGRDDCGGCFGVLISLQMLGFKEMM